MNKSLAQSMESGIAHGTFEKSKGFCLRAARQSAEVIYGSKYDRLFRGDGTERDATAARAGHRFLEVGLGFAASEITKHGGLQAGDMLVKTTVAPNRWGDKSGHIGVVTEDEKRVGENSSTSIGRVHGALGFRTLAQFGSFDIVVRLPDPKSWAPVVAPKPSERGLALYDGKTVRPLESTVQDGHNFAQVTDTLAAAGLAYVTDTQHSKPELLVLKVYKP